MKEIICPKCKTPFILDEVGYADILKQVRDHQFEEEIQKRLDLAEKEKESEMAGKTGTQYILGELEDSCTCWVCFEIFNEPVTLFCGPFLVDNCQKFKKTVF